MQYGDSRIHAFDWLRVLAFGFLIFYHAIQPYNPTGDGWHVVDDSDSELLWELIGWMRHWRLHLLFFVSGFGTYFALRKLSAVGFLRERCIRLGLPLVFGVLVICPPQTWVERVTQSQYSDGFLSFYISDFFTRGLYPEGNLTWTHLWFLPYLLLMSIALLPLLLWLRDSDLFRRDWFEGLSKVQLIVSLVGAAAFPLCASLMLLIWPEQTNALAGDWGWFSVWSAYFLLGFLMAVFRRKLLPVIERAKYVFLSLALLCYGVLWSELNLEYSIVGQGLLRFLAWFFILSLSGFMLRYMNRDSALKRYLNSAIFPLYVVHQTVTVVVAYSLLDLELAVGIKFGTVSVATIVGSFLIFECVVRRIGRAGLLFGYKPSPLRGVL